MKMSWWFEAVRILAGIIVVAGSLRARQAVAAAAQSTCAWRWLETRNFRIHAYSTEPIDASIGEQCERYRNQIATAWFGRRDADNWQPKCDIVLHGTLAGYQAAVGLRTTATTASSRIDRFEHEIVVRRIDVLATRVGWLVHLPHEVTHQVLAEHFGDQQLPRWIDEGMALAADDSGKQEAHRGDLDGAFHAGRLFRLAELTSAREYPPQSIDVFYGQSLSLVEFLVEQGGRRKFAMFADSAQRQGVDTALRSNYGIDGVAGLERDWLDWLFRSPSGTGFARRPLAIARR